MANPPATNIKEVLAAIPSKVSGMKGQKAVYQFDLTGDNGGVYNIVIDDDSVAVNEGPHATPTIKITMSASDYLDLANGKLNPQHAFMSGRLKIAGDMSMAMRMQQLFPHGSGPGTED